MEKRGTTRYNLARFNLTGQVSQPLDISMDLQMAFNGLITSGIRPLEIEHSFDMIFSGSFSMFLGIPIYHDLTMDFNGRFSFRFSASISHDLLTSFNGSIKMGKFSNIDHDLTMEFNGDAHLGKQMPIDQTLEARFTGDVHLGKHIPIEHDLHLTWSGAALMGLHQDTIIEINVTIPPGGELIIDSNTFTAFLDGQRVIHLVEAMQDRWIMFERDTVDLIAGNAQGHAIEGQVLYDERFV